MKNSTFIIFLLITLIQHQSIGQTDKLRNDQCSNRNITLQHIDPTNALYDYTINPNSSGILNFHPFNFDEIGGWDQLTNSITNDPDISFNYKEMTESQLLDGYYYRFSQLYKGIPVTGGGFTILMDVGDPQLFRAPTVPGNPCGGLTESMSANIYEGINLNIAPSINSQSVENYLAGDVLAIQEADLKIVNNPMGFCDYKLVWEVYYKEKTQKDLVSLIDANTGEIFYTAHQAKFKLAPVELGSFIDLNDTPLDGFSDILRNNRLAVHDMTEVTFFADPLQGNIPITSAANLRDQFFEDQIPLSPRSRNHWLIEDAPLEVFRAFMMGDQILEKLDSELGIVLDDILRIGVHPTAAGSFYLPPTPNSSNANIDQHHIGLGLFNGNPTVEYDIIGHEIGHIILQNYIDGNQIEANSMTEGICDMIGTFVEAELNGLDWVFGDNIPATLRNLQNTPRRCFPNIAGLTQPHDRSEALGHWFFLCVNGDAANNIAPMNITQLMRLIFEALPNLNTNPDYPDVMEVTVDLARMVFGTCSDQFKTIVRAWDQICVPTGEAVVNPQTPCTSLYSTAGPWVCEEEEEPNNGLFFSICLPNNSGLDVNLGRWYILGRNSIDFQSVLGMSGNIQQGGDCIDISHIPDMPYYPQVITIKYQHPGLDGPIYKKMVIRDCDGDDPTCEDYYNLGNRQNRSIGLVDNENLESESIENLELIIYDLMGKKLSTYEVNNKTGVVVYTYWDKNGKLRKSKKVFIYEN